MMPLELLLLEENLLLRIIVVLVGLVIDFEFGVGVLQRN